MGTFIDLTGKKFARLQVIRQAERLGKATLWLCKCDCGKEHIAMSGNLKSGHTKSCGCLASELARDRVVSRERPENIKRIHEIYRAMKKRCYNHKHKYYKHYGGRGIQICKQWLQSRDKFTQWSLANGYAENLTIDRINNDGDYAPKNCRWTTRKEQQNNRRNTVFVTYDGQQICYQKYLEIVKKQKEE